jgi:hypothetical protein
MVQELDISRKACHDNFHRKELDGLVFTISAAAHAAVKELGYDRINVLGIREGG